MVNVDYVYLCLSEGACIKAISHAFNGNKEVLIQNELTDEIICDIDYNCK